VTRFAAVEDLPSVWDVFARSFNFPAEDYERWLAQSDPARVLACFDGRRAVAASKILSFGQWFNGRRVPVAGYSPVAVAPEHRGRGLGRAVTAGQFADLRARREVVAALFPSSVALYRSVGFELAGGFVDRTVPASHLRSIVGGHDIEVRVGQPADIERVRRCYDRIAPSRHGYLDRADEMWARRLPPDLAGLHLYVVDASPVGELAGYVIYRHVKGRDPYDYGIRVVELLADDPGTSAALWRVVASSSTQAPDVSMTGPPEDPLLLQLPAADPTAVRGEVRWMIRLVDAAAAVAARRYRPSTEARVELEIVDADAAWNAGRWVLEVADGHGQLTPGGGGAVEATIGGLSSLWVGYASARTLEATGHLRSFDPGALDALDDVFAGPAPAVLDYY